MKRSSSTSSALAAVALVVGGVPSFAERWRPATDVICKYSSWEEADREELECGKELTSVMERAGDLLVLKLDNGEDRVITLDDHAPDEKYRLSRYDARSKLVIFDLVGTHHWGTAGFDLKTGHKTHFMTGPRVSPDGTLAIDLGQSGPVSTAHLFMIWNMSVVPPKVVWRQRHRGAGTADSSDPSQAVWISNDRIRLKLYSEVDGKTRSALILKARGIWRIVVFKAED